MSSSRVREELEASLRCLRPAVSRCTSQLSTVPAAAFVARLAKRQLAGGASAADVALVYLRRAEAEENWEKGLLKSPLARLTR